MHAVETVVALQGDGLPKELY